MDFVSRTLDTDAMPGRVFPEASETVSFGCFATWVFRLLCFFRFLNCRGLVGEVCCEVARIRNTSCPYHGALATENVCLRNSHRTMHEIAG